MTEAIITIEDLQPPVEGKNIKTVHISGQLDESNVDEKIKEIYEVVNKNTQGLNLIFDLTELEYMNSKSIGYLTDLYGKITEMNGNVAIANAKNNILDILQVVGLTQLIETFNSIEEAKDHLVSQPEPQPEAPAQAEPQPEAPAQAENTPKTDPSNPPQENTGEDQKETFKLN